MKIGRNDLCPCGSGKKHKKCCMLKGRGVDAGSEGANTSKKLPDEFKNYSDEELTFLYNAVHNIRRYTLEQKSHVKEYDKLRKMHGEVLNSMMQYYESGKFVPALARDFSDELMSSYAKGELSVLYADFDLETREGNQALADVLVYKGAPNMNCITEDYINSKRFRKPEKVEFLQSMLDSAAGLFTIADVDRNEGYAYLEEVFSGNTFKITDVGLSGDPGHDRFYIYTRIITHKDISFSTGLNIVFLKNDTFIKGFIKRHKKAYLPDGEFVRFTELYNRYSADSGKVKSVSKYERA